MQLSYVTLGMGPRYVILVTKNEAKTEGSKLDAIKIACLVSPAAIS